VTLEAEDFLQRGVERRWRKRHVGTLLAAQFRCGALRKREWEEQAVKIADFVEL